MQDVQYRMEQYYKNIEEELATVKAERDAMTRLVQNQFEVEKELLLVKAERDGLASVLQDVRDELIEEKRIVKGLLDAILEHIGASIEYE